MRKKFFDLVNNILTKYPDLYIDIVHRDCGWSLYGLLRGKSFQCHGNDVDILFENAYTKLSYMVSTVNEEMNKNADYLSHNNSSSSDASRDDLSDASFF